MGTSFRWFGGQGSQNDGISPATEWSVVWGDDGGVLMAVSLFREYACSPDTVQVFWVEAGKLDSCIQFNFSGN